MKCLWCTDDNPIFEARMDSPCSFPCVAKASKEDERKCIESMLFELAEWRSGKRRVFWRIRSSWGIDLCVSSEFGSLKKAREELTHRFTPTLYRITVRPKGAKR